MDTLSPQLNTKLLIRLREHRGWSPQKAATEMGLSTQGLLNLESGRSMPMAATLANIARVYGVKMDDFYREERRNARAV